MYKSDNWRWCVGSLIEGFGLLFSSRAASIWLCLISLTFGVLHPGLAEAETSQQVHILIVTGGHDFEEPEFFAMFNQMKGISFSHVAYGQDSTMKLSPEEAKDFDAIVFYDMHQDKEPQWKGITQMLGQGKGMVFLHHSLWSYDGTWPEYARILGGRASSKEQVVPGLSPTSTYKHGEQVRVHIADKSSPITNGLDDFTIEDETYNHYWVDPQVQVLLTTDNATSEREIAWSHNYDRSRVVYIELGHGPSAYENENYRTLVRQAIFWVSKK